MQNISYPLTFKFRISTFTNDFIATDDTGRTIAYVKQKFFKFIEEINIYSDESQSGLIYRINADRWLDFSASYAFSNANGEEIGRITRKGWASIWRASYEIYNQAKGHEYTIREERVWVKVLDSLFGEIPLVGIFTGYVFNPSYIVLSTNDMPVARLKKAPSFFGRKFTVEKLANLTEREEERIILGLMMMILLERRRG